MKKIISLLASLALLSTVYAKTKVVVTIFPIYDWAREITKGTDTDITMLLDNGTDLHSYNPSVRDIAKISDADVFIYVGGESDKWVEAALKNVRNKNMKSVNLIKKLGDKAKIEEKKEGMEYEEDAELDEHIWLSLRNAKVLSGAICEAISSADSKNSQIYRANLDALTQKFSELDKAFSDATKAAPSRTLIFADRFPFRYLVDDYDLDYFAAFAGCSAETEASFKTVAFLSNKADELKAKSICVIETSDKKIAQTVIANSKNKGCRISVLDSMQATTSKDIKNGTTYLTIMKKNLEVLKEVLR